MKFYGTFVTAKIDVNKYEALLKDYLRQQLKEVIKAWLSGVTGRVPIWSGMAQGSLQKIAEFAGDTLTIVPVAGVKSRVSRGKELGTIFPKEVLNDFSITIVTDVNHYNIQEYTDVGVSPTAPWGSLKAGKESALEIMKQVTLPIPVTISKKIKF